MGRGVVQPPSPPLRARLSQPARVRIPASRRRHPMNPSMITDQQESGVAGARLRRSRPPAKGLALPETGAARPPRPAGQLSQGAPTGLGHHHHQPKTRPRKRGNLNAWHGRAAVSAIWSLVTGLILRAAAQPVCPRVPMTLSRIWASVRSDSRVGTSRSRAGSVCSRGSKTPGCRRRHSADRLGHECARGGSSFLDCSGLHSEHGRGELRRLRPAMLELPHHRPV